MAYTLKHLNVVKTVETVAQRDALLEKGFKEIKDEKPSRSKNNKKAEQPEKEEVKTDPEHPEQEKNTGEK